MNTIGRVDSLWRYPVKSMRGEELEEAFAGFSGLYGDRVFAFHSSAAPKGFPYLTAREQERMLLCRPSFRSPHRMAQPVNLAEAEAIAPGATPAYATPEETMVDVETPAGERFAIDDPRLIAWLREGIRDLALELVRSDRAQTDCRPLSLFSIVTARQLSDEVGAEVDKRRFRANIYVDVSSGQPFEEDGWVGRTLRIGPKLTVSVVDRDPRCKMITLDPDTAHPNPDVIRRVARNHDGKAGVYAAVLVEGTVHPGDPIALLD